MENEYLSCVVLPDLGGRLYTCTDRLNGYSLFYGNPTIRQALPLGGGAWAAMGVALDFAGRRGLTSLSPVNFGIRDERDRAVVWVGDVDRISGLEWLIEFSLRPGSAVLEEKITIRNATPVPQPLRWSTAAIVPVEPETRVALPTRLRLLEGPDIVDTWPIDSSHIDDSLVTRYQDPATFRAYRSRERFMAVYHPAARTATVHYAETAARMKVVTLGARQAARIRDTLSGDGRPFVELRTGPEGSRLLAPFESAEFTEYWMAARELGGVSRATRDAILHLTRRVSGGKRVLAVEWNVTRPIAGARLRIAEGASVRVEDLGTLTPEKPLLRSIENPSDNPYHLELLDGAGRVVLSHTEGVYDAAGPEEVAAGVSEKPANGNSPREYLARAAEDAAAGRFAKAEEIHAAALKRFRSDLEVKKAAGRLMALRKNFDAAAKLLADTVAAKPEDLEARYLLGIALAGSGKEEDARRQWEPALADGQFGAAAALEIGALEARLGKPDAALAMIRRALEKSPGLLAAGRIEVALLRSTGQPAAAKDRLSYWLARAPLDPFLRAEQGRLERFDDDFLLFLGADSERVLDLADAYIEIGAYGDALSVLELDLPEAAGNQRAPSAVAPATSPLAALYRAYCRRKLGRNDDADLRSAEALPLDYSFPYRASSLAMLRETVQRHPRSASARWFLGLSYMHSGRIADAVSEWQWARTLGKTIPALHATLGEALLRENEKPMALAVFSEGLNLDPTDPLLQKRFRELGGRARAATAGSAGKTSPPDVARRALLELGVGRIASAQALFTAANFPNEKQEPFVREAYLELQLQRVRDLVIQGHCDDALRGVETIGAEDKALDFTLYGFDTFIKEPRLQYALGDVEFACGDAKAARKRWTKVMAAKPEVQSADFAFPVMAAFRLGNAGTRAAAQDGLLKVEAALPAAEPAHRGVLLYSRGMLLSILREREKARQAFLDGAAAPDQRLSQYLNVRALHEMN